MGELNEIKEVVILAAGRSRRMEELSNSEPKCLLPYGGERILERLVRQIKNCGVEKIVITTGYCADTINNIFADDSTIETIENTLYEEDVNIYSMSLALSKINGACVIFEADTVMEDSLVKYVLGADFEGKSVWFTRGRFNESQYGGILLSDDYGHVKDIRIVSMYQDVYRNYSKLSGLMRIGPSEIDDFRNLVNRYSKLTLKQYYLIPWIENLRMLPCIEADISNFDFYTFNKPEEYYQLQGKVIGLIQEAPTISFAEVNNLKHIENYDDERVSTLEKRILSVGTWEVPLIVDRKDYLVLDGQHRLEVSKKMGLKTVPVIYVDYDDVVVWSLRKEIKISSDLVRDKIVNQREIYPYKTVKHKFDFEIPNNLGIPLENLGWSNSI